MFSAYEIRIYRRRTVWEQSETSGSKLHFTIAADLVSEASQLPYGLEWITKSEALEGTLTHIHEGNFAEVVDGAVPAIFRSGAEVAGVLEVSPPLLLGADSKKYLIFQISPYHLT